MLSPSASTTSTSSWSQPRIGVVLTGVRVGSSSCAVSGSSDGVVGALVEVTKPWVEICVTSALSGPLIVARKVIVVSTPARNRAQVDANARVASVVARRDRPL